MNWHWLVLQRRWRRCQEDEEKVMIVVDKARVLALQERRCDSKGKGAVYDPVLGICCHFCRYIYRMSANVYNQLVALCS